METSALSQHVEEVRSDLEAFISTREIDIEKVEKYDRYIELSHNKKVEWALSTKFEPINSLRVYIGYKLIHDSLKNSQIKLKEAKSRGENPTTAEKLQPYFSELVLFTKIFEKELEKDQTEINFGFIEKKSREIMARGRELQLISYTDSSRDKFYEKLQAVIASSLEL